jgi:hypothetical protein
MLFAIIFWLPQAQLSQKTTQIAVRYALLKYNKQDNRIIKV